MKWFVVFALMVACVYPECSAQNAESNVPPALTYSEQIEILESETQSRITVLARQAETDPSKREELEKQIVALKHQTEIQRLEILLAWAESENDQNRIAEIKKALDHWRYPAAPGKQSPVPRDPPSTQRAVPESKDSPR